MQSEKTWPAISQKSMPWSVSGIANMSRRQALQHRGNYFAAVVPLIAKQKIELSMSEIAIADEAIVELSRFDAEVGTMIAPFTAILLRSEAASSSQIENLTSTPAAVVKAELGLASTPNSSLVVSNQLAMSAAVEASANLSTASLLKMHEILLGNFDSENAGKLRNEPVWIGGSANGPHNADYVAPDYREVPTLLADLISFCERTDMPALIQVALAHAQFETIHPFTDGNGRTGRALVQVLLNRLGVTKSVMAPVSAGLLRDTRKYFQALGEYRSGNPVPIVRVFAEAILIAVQTGRALAAELEAVRVFWGSKVKTRSDAGSQVLLDYLLGQPVITNARAVEILQRTPANAQGAIDKLVEVGILVAQGSAKRNRVWQADDVLNALDRFAVKVKRD